MSAWFEYPQYHWKKKQATIIGGGIAGAQIAWHLCQKNWQVTLIEQRKELAREASGNPAGVILPKMTAQPSEGETFYVQSFKYTLDLLETLEKQGKQLDRQACGAIQLAYNPREIKRWKALKNRKLSETLIQLLDEKKTEEAAGIKLHPEKAYLSTYFPQAGWINPSSFIHALTRHPNCQIILQKEALLLYYRQSQWQVINDSGKLINESEILILANGKSLCDFEQTQFLPHMPVAGQTTSAHASTFSEKLKTVIGHEGYLTPAIITQETKGKHIFGATFNRNNKHPRIRLDDDTENLRQLSRYLPTFVNSLTRIESAHAAVRMTTPDRFPYVGGIPDKHFYQKQYHDIHQGKQWKEYPKAEYLPGLFVLGGLGSRGLTTSAYCANALSRLLNNELDSDSKTTLKNCHPGRFIIKQLKRNQL